MLNEEKSQHPLKALSQFFTFLPHTADFMLGLNNYVILMERDDKNNSFPMVVSKLKEEYGNYTKIINKCIGFEISNGFLLVQPICLFGKEPDVGTNIRFFNNKKEIHEYFKLYIDSTYNLKEKTQIITRINELSLENDNSLHIKNVVNKISSLKQYRDTSLQNNYNN